MKHSVAVAGVEVVRCFIVCVLNDSLGLARIFCRRGAIMVDGRFSPDVVTAILLVVTSSGNNLAKLITVGPCACDTNQ